MTSNRLSLIDGGKRLFWMLAVCIPLLMLAGVAQAQHSEPSAGAKGMPGALGTMEYKPTDWKGNITTYWKDTDGVDPGVAGCHIGVTENGHRRGARRGPERSSGGRNSSL
jgi:hypothetical protein